MDAEMAAQIWESLDKTVAELCEGLRAEFTPEKVTAIVDNYWKQVTIKQLEEQIQTGLVGLAESNRGHDLQKEVDGRAGMGRGRGRGKIINASNAREEPSRGASVAGVNSLIVADEKKGRTKGSSVEVRGTPEEMGTPAKARVGKSLVRLPPNLSSNKAIEKTPPVTPVVRPVAAPPAKKPAAITPANHKPTPVAPVTFQATGKQLVVQPSRFLQPPPGPPAAVTPKGPPPPKPSGPPPKQQEAYSRPPAPKSRQQGPAPRRIPQKRHVGSESHRNVVPQMIGDEWSDGEDEDKRNARIHQFYQQHKTIQYFKPDF